MSKCRGSLQDSKVVVVGVGGGGGGGRHSRGAITLNLVLSQRQFLWQDVCVCVTFDKSAEL